MDPVSVLRARNALVDFSVGNFDKGDRSVDEIAAEDLETLRRAAALLAGSLQRRELEIAFARGQW